MLTALCATAIATAQPTDQYSQDYSQTTEWVDTQATTPAAVETPAYAQPQEAPAAPQAMATQETAAAPVATEQQASNESMPIDEQYTPQKKQKIGFGARASFIYGKLWGFKDLDDLDEPTGFGADFGVAVRFTITKGLLFNPEIAFRLLYLEHGDDDYSRNFDMTFLDFAFYMRGEISSAFYLEVGPQISINTSGSYTIENKSGSYDNFENIEQAPVELGINIGVGYNILENLSVSFRWYMGFNEVFPDVKYLDELTQDDYDNSNGNSKIKSSVKCSVSNLKGAHSMMFKLGLTYWFI